ASRSKRRAAPEVDTHANIRSHVAGALPAGPRARRRDRARGTGFRARARKGTGARAPQASGPRPGAWPAAADRRPGARRLRRLGAALAGALGPRLTPARA